MKNNYKLLGPSTIRRGTLLFISKDGFSVSFIESMVEARLAWLSG